MNDVDVQNAYQPNAVHTTYPFNKCQIHEQNSCSSIFALTNSEHAQQIDTSCSKFRSRQISLLMNENVWATATATANSNNNRQPHLHRFKHFTLQTDALVHFFIPSIHFDIIIHRVIFGTMNNSLYFGTALELITDLNDS